MPIRPLCAVTMAYNERTLLPVWVDYYGRQVGLENCFVVDHGSDDGSTAALPPEVSVIRLPRRDHRDVDRASMIIKFCSALLVTYQRVLYTDCDEIVVAEPDLFEGLVDFAERVPAGVLTTLGMDIVHDPRTEPPLDLRRSILSQRRLARANGLMCKPLMIDREVIWWNGFHAHDGPARFEHFYLFHLAYCDAGLIRERQAKRNASAPTDGGGAHHRVAPEAFAQRLADEVSALETVPCSLMRGDPERERFVAGLFGPNGSEGLAKLENYDLRADRLWRLPERFAGLV
jgi:hypothetical protein